MKYPRGRFFITYTELFKVLIGALTSINLFKNSNAIEELKSYFETENLFLCPSYRIGLAHSLKALNLLPQDEVILTPITIPDTVNAILVNKLKPIFIDHDKETHNINIASLKEAITPKTKVIIITYLSGITNGAVEVRNICQEYNITLIEDFSQAYGAEIGEEKAGNFGDISIGSLSSGKTISSLFGGLVIAKDKDLLNKIRKGIDKEIKDAPYQRFMILFQVFDNLKINFFCSKYIFNFFTFYILWIVKRFFPSAFNKVEQSRSVARLINQDIYFADSDQIRSKFPDFFYYKLKKYQKGLICSMLSRINANDLRRENFTLLLENLSPRIKDLFLAKGLLNTKENVYYHIPFHSPLPTAQMQDILLNNGIDVATYGLPNCNELNSFVDFKRHCPIAQELKNKTIFVPIFENHTKKEVIKIAQKLNQILSNYSK